MENITKFLMNFLNIENIYLIKIIYTLITFLILKIISKIIKLINQKAIISEKQLYMFHKRNKAILTIVFMVIVTIIWKDDIANIITLISFISAAITLAAKDIIFNYFSGIYIKLAKPFKLEDRIKVGEIIGDVVNINSLSFLILEVDTISNQSTGKIIHVPNSQIFNSNVNNYNTAFKYIWDEININIDINSDIESAKNILVNIINDNEIIKDIPKKMKQEIKESMSDYRIYYNKFTPIIYTKIDEGKIILTARFLIHPKKQRNVESELYEKVIEEFKKNSITLI